MDRGRLGRALRAIRGLPAFLGHSLDLASSVEALEIRMDGRAENFLRSAGVIYDLPGNPFRRLLLAAGCEYADLAAGVRGRGLESTLETLRAAGVFLSFDEFKSGIPVVRGELAFDIHPEDFDNPAVTGKGIPAATSGSRSGRAMRVPYDWDFIAAEAANECVLSAAHGILDAPQALWYPGLPGIAGLHNVLIAAKFRRPPERWFAHGNAGGGRQPWIRRSAVRGLSAAGRVYGLRLPRPEPTNLEDALRVAHWLAEAAAKRGISVLRGFTGSVVRAVQAALEHGLDVSRSIVFTGGEPLTAARRGFIESSGARVHPRYVATETGLIGAACPFCEPPDEMHVYMDRLAVLPPGTPEGGLLYTTLLPGAGKILLNTDIGDGGAMTRKPCSCPFGRLGMDIRVREIGSRERITIEGMTVPVRELDAVLGAVAAEAGGNPDDVQVREVRDERGFGRLRIVVGPGLDRLDEGRLVEALFRKLEARDPGHRMTAGIWGQAGSVEVVRGRPDYTPGYKRRLSGVAADCPQAGGSPPPGIESLPPAPTLRPVRRSIVTRATFPPPEGSSPPADPFGRSAVTRIEMPAAAPDPWLWAALQEASARENGSNFIFRRGIAAALDVCAAAVRPGEIWLDAGCGTGRLAHGLSRTDVTVVGIDKDARLASRAAAAGGARGPGLPKRAFLAADALRLPFGDESFDGAAAVSLAGCLASPEGFCREIGRVLRPKGTAVVTFTNKDSRLHGIQHALNRFRRAPTEGRYRGYSPAEAQALFEKAGFRIRGVRFYNFVVTAGSRLLPPRRTALFLERRVRGGGGRRWGRNFVIVAGKL